LFYLASVWDIKICVNACFNGLKEPREALLVHGVYGSSKRIDILPFETAYRETIQTIRNIFKFNFPTEQ